jgi:twitching motility protein PilT
MVAHSAQELYLEPNKIPYLVSNNGQINLSETELQGPQISLMVFPIIPEDVKMELPNKSEIQFSFNNKHGEFNFTVRKSPSGFNVSVKTVSLNSETPNLSSLTKENTQVVQSFNQPVSTSQPESVNPVVTAANKVSLPNSQPTFEQPLNNTLLNKTEVPTVSNSQNFSYPNEVETPKTVETPIVKLEVPTQNVNSSLPQTVISQSQTVVSQSQTVVSETKPSDFPMQSANLQSEPIVSQPVVAQTTDFTTQQTQSTSTFTPAKTSSSMQQKMDSFFYKMAQMGASDLHMSVSMPPMVRKDGRIQVLEEGGQTLTPASMKELLTSIMPEKNQEEFERRHDTDFAYEIKGLARFRANIFMDRKGMGGVFRIIPDKILTAQDLGLSEAILKLCELSKGLVVVTGPTGSGKSTTLCAMVDHINQNRDDHLITIEDPIEFVHDNKKCLVNQREVHNHTDSFKDALRAALREDPDILLVGEMRDLETISIAIETAETGHLVFGTLHTTTAASTVDRIIDQFPADRQQQIRVMLSESLKGVIAQTLLPKKGGGRIAALEVLIVTPAISNLIREGKTFQIPSAMQTGKQHGMVLLNDALLNLVQKGLVEAKDAYIKAVDKTGFEMALNRVGLKM